MSRDDLVRVLVRERFGPYPLLARELPQGRLPPPREDDLVIARRRRVLRDALDVSACTRRVA